MRSAKKILLIVGMLYAVIFFLGYLLIPHGSLAESFLATFLSILPVVILLSFLFSKNNFSKVPVGTLVSLILIYLWDGLAACMVVLSRDSDRTLAIDLVAVLSWVVFMLWGATILLGSLPRFVAWVRKND